MATDQEIFASATSPEPLAAAEPAPAPVTTEPTPQAEPQPGQPRDEHGRFASPAPAAAAPQAEPSPASPEPAAPAASTGGDDGNVPSWRLREIREERDALRRELAATRAAPPKQPAAPEPEPAAFWDDPERNLQERDRALEQRIGKVVEGVSRRMAVKEYGLETVKAAYDDMDQRVARGDPGAVAAHQRMLQSDDPYGDLVTWHKREQTVSRVGDDPEAWFEQQLEERAKDPAFQAKLRERLGVVPATPGAQPAARPSTVVSLPPSLSRATSVASASDAPVDASDRGLFSHATAGMR